MMAQMARQQAAQTKLLSNGALMPALGLGTWGMQGKEMEATLFAWEVGYRHIDTAKIYGTEAGIGKAIREGAIPRGELWITSKLWNGDQGYERALRAIDETLRRLDTTYVDLYLIHWPYTGEDKGENKRTETWRAMEEIYASGKARAIGVSNYQISHLEEVLSVATVAPMVNQIERHPFYQQREVVDFCERNDIAITNYSPLTRGHRTSDPTAETVANKHDKSTAQIFLRWGLQKGNIVIPKAAQKVHIEENAGIFDFKLDEDDMALLDALEEDYSVV